MNSSTHAHTVLFERKKFVALLVINARIHLLLISTIFFYCHSQFLWINFFFFSFYSSIFKTLRFGLNIPNNNKNKLKNFQVKTTKMYHLQEAFIYTQKYGSLRNKNEISIRILKQRKTNLRLNLKTTKYFRSTLRL